MSGTLHTAILLALYGSTSHSGRRAAMCLARIAAAVSAPAVDVSAALAQLAGMGLVIKRKSPVTLGAEWRLVDSDEALDRIIRAGLASLGHAAAIGEV